MSASSRFKTFFKDFDSNMYRLGASGYGISITTLEEVFLAVGDGREINEHHDARAAVRKKILKASGTLGELEEDKEEESLISSVKSDKKNKKAAKKRKIEQELESFTIS